MESFFCPDTFQGQPSLTDDGIGTIKRFRNHKAECEIAYIIPSEYGDTYLTHETKIDDGGSPISLVATGATFEEAESKLAELIK